jgi:hypothetical protein
MNRKPSRLPKRNREEPTWLQEDQTEPGDEPDRVYEAEIERRAEAEEE